MKKFEVIEHTADVGIRAWGRDAAELFANAALGMVSLMAEPASIKPNKSLKIEVKAGNTESLLVEWLNELIYLTETKNLIFSRFSILGLTQIRLSAVAFGELIDPTKHELKTEIKACTYHDLKIGKKEGRMSAQVIFDV